ncbi:MAG: ABC transporter [Oceanospirillaceae bacterium]|nr:ABC transporter [Oceanospirillaceae bacterium]|tara:strand:+ start:1562 stop:2203 length:642 start_codon:yes stop_codon:yes gene_type:complete
MTYHKDIIISLSDVSVRYKRRGGLFSKAQYFEALTGVSFDIYRGETLGIVGRNGAGKSTLLKTIAGIIKPDSGEVVNMGVSVSLLALQAGFDPELTGRDNALINGMLLGYTKTKIKKNLEKIKEFSELGDFFEEPVKAYSSGMRSRLGFAVSVYLKPDVLLLDEILSVGDSEFKIKAEKEIIKKCISDQTVIMVSHSQNQLNRLCTRVIEVKK